MQDFSNKYLLMIEPSASIAAEPVVDSLTRRMTAALNRAAKKDFTRGWHTAASGAWSDNCTHVITMADGRQLETHSLAVHYVAYSRHEIPASELVKLEGLPLTEEEPTEEQLFRQYKVTNSLREPRPRGGGWGGI